MLSASLLTACASAPKPLVPESLLSCLETPEVPPKGAKSRAVANYIVDLYDAHDDCFTKLNAVSSVIRPDKGVVTPPTE